MSSSQADQAGFLLHRRPYRETSFLVDLLTREHGRISAVARGARRAKDVPLQPFFRLSVSWRGRGQLPTVTSYEVEEQHRLVGRNLYAGLYINEILVRTLRAEETVEGFFESYEKAIEALALQLPIEPVLRGFEIELLEKLGYALEFGFDAGTGAEIDRAGHYQYVHELGFERVDSSRGDSFDGGTLLEIANGDFSKPAARRAAKHILRRALRPLIGDKPLASRALFAGPRER